MRRFPQPCRQAGTPITGREGAFPNRRGWRYVFDRK